MMIEFNTYQPKIWVLFRRRKRDDEDKINERLEIPDLRLLEKWVTTLIVSLKLKPGNFTFLPAYGGVLLFIRDEGISWIPYSDIRELLGKVDKGKLVESSAMIGGVAAVTAGALALPALLVPTLLKGSYRTIFKPSPKHSMNFLKSLIDEVIIVEKKLPRRVLETFEEVPYKEIDETNISTYTITIYRKFMDNLKKSSQSVRILKKITDILSREEDAVFSIPPNNEINKFVEILQKNSIPVVFNQSTIKKMEEGLPKTDN